MELDLEMVEQCPFCNSSVALWLLEEHVNNHLEEEDLASDRALAQQLASNFDAPCCVGGRNSCGESTDNTRGAGASRESVQCNLGCRQAIRIEEWESHRLQHVLALEEVDGNDTFFSKRARGSSEVEVRRLARSLRNNKSLEENLRVIVQSQAKESAVPVKDGLMILLRRCVEADQQRTGVSSAVALAGYVEHFESNHQKDLGWGCGWRNIQMLSSHLLSQDPEAKAVLFGGVGFVPDIQALQRWLEIAWAKGFDNAGAEYFNWEIDGSHKWIGTTECATLLRSFGIRARIIDFQALGGKKQHTEVVGGKKNKKTGLDSAPSRSGLTDNKMEQQEEFRTPSPVDDAEGECIGCGEYPIQGKWFRRDNLAGSDLCLSCMEKLKSSTNKHDIQACAKYQGMEMLAGQGASYKMTGNSSANASGIASGNASEDRGINEPIISHQHLVDWVWNYFANSRDDKSPCSTAFDQLRKPIIISKRSPLYFQHKGHSRTIVGIERRRRQQGNGEEVFLLVLDPSQRTEEITKCLTNKRGWQRLLKRGLHTLRQSEYQLCYVDKGVAYGEELENLKILSSVRHTF